MLIKLLKHEYYYILKTFTPIYAIFIGLAVLVRIMIAADIPNKQPDETLGFTLTIMFSCFLIAFIFMIFFTGLMTIVHNSRRFKKNMFSDEGYLTNTLPVTVNEHIIAKLVAGGTNFLASAVVVIIGLLIVGQEVTVDVLSDLIDLILTDDFTLLQKLLFLLIGLLGYITLMLLCYVCAGVDSMANSKGCVGALIGFLAYFVFTISVSLITEFAIETLEIETIESLELIFIVFFTACGAILYAILHNMLKNHLNLQ